MPHRLSPRAAEDIASIFRQSVLNFGLAHADRYLRDLEACFELLSLNPMQAAVRADLGRARLKRHAAHHVYYIVDGDMVVIVRVLHGRQDASRHLKL